MLLPPSLVPLRGSQWARQRGEPSPEARPRAAPRGGLAAHPARAQGARRAPTGSVHGKAHPGHEHCLEGGWGWALPGETEASGGEAQPGAAAQPPRRSACPRSRGSLLLPRPCAPRLGVPAGINPPLSGCPKSPRGPPPQAPRARITRPASATSPAASSGKTPPPPATGAPRPTRRSWSSTSRWAGLRARQGVGGPGELQPPRHKRCRLPAADGSEADSGRAGEGAGFLLQQAAGHRADLPGAREREQPHHHRHRQRPLRHGGEHGARVARLAAGTPSPRAFPRPKPPFPSVQPLLHPGLPQGLGLPRALRHAGRRHGERVGPGQGRRWGRVRRGSDGGRAPRQEGFAPPEDDELEEQQPEDQDEY